MQDAKEDLVELFGTHGTVRSHADQIQKVGFLSVPGRHGKGVYLWAAENLNDENAKLLAECFADDSRTRQAYANVNDDSTRVLACELLASLGGLLNFSDLKVTNLFRKHVKRSSSWLRQARSSKEKKMRVAKVCDNFIETLEELEKRQYDIIAVQTAVPESYLERDYYNNWLGLNKARCYVVKNNSCFKSIQVV